MSRRRITADNEFSMFSPEQIALESQPSAKVTIAWASLAIATSLFWGVVIAVVTWLS